HQPVVSEHTVDFRDTTARIHHVLEHRLDDDAVEAAVCKRDVVRIADEGRQRSKGHIGAHAFERWIVGKRLHSFAEDASTYDEHSRPRRLLEQRLMELAVALLALIRV